VLTVARSGRVEKQAGPEDLRGGVGGRQPQLREAESDRETPLSIVHRVVARLRSKSEKPQKVVRFPSCGAIAERAHNVPQRLTDGIRLRWRRSDLINLSTFM
jgi:hypothetical protein